MMPRLSPLNFWCHERIFEVLKPKQPSTKFSSFVFNSQKGSLCLQLPHSNSLPLKLFRSSTNSSIFVLPPNGGIWCIGTKRDQSYLFHQLPFSCSHAELYILNIIVLIEDLEFTTRQYMNLVKNPCRTIYYSCMSISRLDFKHILRFRRINCIWSIYFKFLVSIHW